MLERITYVSRAAPGLRREDVFGIIRTAHPANSLAGISGGLIFLDGWFAQVLEGGSGALDHLLARLAQDPRHRGLAPRSRERGLCRLFAGQAMALRTRACVDPRLLEAFSYAPGFPVEAFPADVLVEFAVQVCRRAPGQKPYQAPDGLRRAGSHPDELRPEGLHSEGLRAVS